MPLRLGAKVQELLHAEMMCVVAGSSLDRLTYHTDDRQGEP